MFPKTFKQLANLMTNGVTFEVECLKKVEDLEGYAERGMRLTIYGIQEQYDDVIMLQVSYEKYDEFNLTFESRNYYDKCGVACLTAREASFYDVKDTMHVMETDDPNDYFISINDLSNKWITRYLNEKQGEETYVAFLERMLDTASIK